MDPSPDGATELKAAHHGGARVRVIVAVVLIDLGVYVVLKRRHWLDGKSGDRPRSPRHDGFVTALDDPWLSPARPDVRLVQVPAPALAALAAGHAEGAGRAVPGLHIDPELATDHCRRVWQIRAEQVRERPADASWVTRLLVDSSLVAATRGAAGSGTGLGSGPAAHGGTAVGRAGFHGPPDARGMVEVGYEVVPWARRRGYARAAMDALLAVARDRADVRVLRATVRPDNVASRALVESFGLVEVGEQWDDEDGLETIFELPVV